MTTRVAGMIVAALLAACGTVAAQGGTVAPSSGGRYANLAPYRQDTVADSASARSERAFVSYFQLNVPGDPPFMWMLWKRSGDPWWVHYWTLSRREADSRDKRG